MASQRAGPQTETSTLSAKRWSWLLELIQSQPNLLKRPWPPSTRHCLLSLPSSCRGYGQESTLTSQSYLLLRVNHARYPTTCKVTPYCSKCRSQRVIAKRQSPISQPGCSASCCTLLPSSRSSRKGPLNWWLISLWQQTTPGSTSGLTGWFTTKTSGSLWLIPGTTNGWRLAWSVYSVFH